MQLEIMKFPKIPNMTANLNKFQSKKKWSKLCLKILKTHGKRAVRPFLDLGGLIGVLRPDDVFSISDLGTVNFDENHFVAV